MEFVRVIILVLAGLTGFGVGAVFFMRRTLHHLLQITQSQGRLLTVVNGRLAVVERIAGVKFVCEHNENCDVFQTAPDGGPSQKPCNCKGTLEGDGQTSVAVERDDFVLFDVHEGDRCCGKVALCMAWSEHDILTELRSTNYPLDRKSGHIAVFRGWPSDKEFTLTWGDVVFKFVKG